MKVGITHGDFNGANYDILLKTFEEPHILELLTPILYGSAKAAAQYSKLLGVQPVSFNIIESASAAKDGVVNLIDVTNKENIEITPGQSTPQAGKAAREALERAVSDLEEGDIDVLVTAPINKENTQSDDFRYPGHTEFLEARLGEGEESQALMILCSETLRVALVTCHIPLKDVAAMLDENKILEKLRLFRRSLQQDFTVTEPKIAVLSLNPHAGEGGLLGTEEQQIIEPAIETARSEGILAFGPYAADGFFGSGNYRNFDGVLAMYHDQGLIPFKMLAMENGVNYTAGLPYVRTSPDHGTAYDIAGKGTADPASLRSAIYMAMDIFRNRERNIRAGANPLPKLYNTTPTQRD